MPSKQKEVKHVGQWYWDTDHLGNKYKALYFGPRIEWMNLDKDELSNTRKNKRVNRTTKNIS